MIVAAVETMEVVIGVKDIDYSILRVGRLPDGSRHVLCGHCREPIAVISRLGAETLDEVRKGWVSIEDVADRDLYDIPDDMSRNRYAQSIDTAMEIMRAYRRHDCKQEPSP